MKSGYFCKSTQDCKPSKHPKLPTTTSNLYNADKVCYMVAGSVIVSMVISAETNDVAKVLSGSWTSPVPSSCTDALDNIKGGQEWLKRHSGHDLNATVFSYQLLL